MAAETCPRGLEKLAQTPQLRVPLLESRQLPLRHGDRDPDLNIECDSPIDELIPTLAGLTLSNAVEGNSVELFENDLLRCGGAAGLETVTSSLAYHLRALDIDHRGHHTGAQVGN